MEEESLDLGKMRVEREILRGIAHDVHPHLIDPHTLPREECTHLLRDVLMDKLLHRCHDPGNRRSMERKARAGHASPLLKIRSSKW